MTQDKHSFLMEFIPLPTSVRKTMYATCIIRLILSLLSIFILYWITSKNVDLHDTHNLQVFIVLCVFDLVFIFIMLRKSYVFYMISGDTTSEFLGDYPAHEAVQVVKMFPEKFIDFSSRLGDGYVSVVHGGGYIIMISKSI